MKKVIASVIAGIIAMQHAFRGGGFCAGQPESQLKSC